MANRIVVACLLLVACSPHSPQCVTDPDCGVDLVCNRGLCIAQPEGTCRSDETRPCGPEAVGLCHPGTQRCSDRHFLETCEGAVNPVAELCNGLDDDCDGVVDNGATNTYYPDLDGDGFGSAVSSSMTRAGCTPPAGYVASHTDCNDSNAGINPGASEVCDAMNVDEDCDGTANEGCGCSNVGMSQGCCADRGTQVCEAHPSGPTLSACTVSPTPELCNAIDDDCDGQTDEQYELGSTDGGSVITDAGVFALDGGCTVGIGACARTAATSCSGGGLTCNVAPGSPSNEACNGLDDDCDGQTDESDPNLCPVSGQLCTAGSCACPSGQSVCGSSCVVLGGACSTGVGACARSGSIACISGATGCNAVAGAPVAEACDGIDNDCDGQVDNGVTITCYPDGDNDTYPTSLTPSQQCPAPGRAAFGNCPSGYVSPTISTQVDCDAANPNLFRLAPTRADADNDGYCVGAATTLCTGTNAPAGRLLAGSCAATDDCNDGIATIFKNYSVRTDADNDAYCVGSIGTQCAGNAPIAGTRLATTCTAMDDCDDSKSGAFKLHTVRTDFDNDGFCVGSTSTQCAGSTPPAGTRAASTCQAQDDCRDTNVYATTVCTITSGYSTTTATKSCGFGYAATETFQVTGVRFCPTGFTHIFQFIGDTRGSMAGDPGGSCTPLSDSSVTMACGSLVFGSFQCLIVGDCIAN